MWPLESGCAQFPPVTTTRALLLAFTVSLAACASSPLPRPAVSCGVSNSSGASKPIRTPPRIRYLGTASVLIEIGPFRFLTDPVFDLPGTKYNFGWGAHSTKTETPKIPPRALGRIDAVLLSHDQHQDNLDVAGRRFLRSGSARWIVTTEAAASRLSDQRELASKLTGLDDWDRCVLSSPSGHAVEIIATPARHGPADWFPGVGDVIGFMLKWEGQEGGAMYLSGDTTLFTDLEEIEPNLAAYDVDRIGVAVLHAGAVAFPYMGWPLNGIRYTFDATEAVAMARILDAQWVVPIHRSGWSHFVQDEEVLREAFLGAEGLEGRLVWLRQGETWSPPALD